MSRSGYDDYGDADYPELAMINWRGAVTSAIRGKRGQAFLREMKAAMDAMPEKRLIAQEFDTPEGVCAIGSVTRARNLDMSKVDPEDYDTVAAIVNIAPALVREIEWENDEGSHRGKEDPEKRFTRVYQWVCSQIKEPKIDG